MRNSLYLAVCYSAILVMTVLFCGPTVKADTKLVKLGFAENWPLTYMENGKPKGILAEMARFSLEALARPYDLKKYPIKRMYRLTETGEIDICIAIDASIIDRDLVLIGTLPLVQVQVRLYSRDFDPDLSLLDLAGEDIIVIAGYTYSGVLKKMKALNKTSQFITAPTAASTMTMLKAGRAKYALGYRRANTKLMIQLGISEVQSRTVHTVPMYYVVSKKSPGSATLLAEMEAAARLFMKQRPGNDLAQ